MMNRVLYGGVKSKTHAAISRHVPSRKAASSRFFKITEKYLKMVPIVNRQKRGFWLNVYYLVPIPPSPLVYWNHEVGGNFLARSLNHKDLYQSILE